MEGESSFGFIVDRTLMRPRNLLRFIRHAVDVALNRGDDRISEDDLLQAERLYSKDVLSETSFEITDTHPELDTVLYAFEGAPWLMQASELADRLLSVGELASESVQDAIDLLLWFGVLGVQPTGQAEPRYAYQVQGEVGRLRLPLDHGDALVVINPAFRSALVCRDPD